MTAGGALDFSFDRRVATQYDALRAHPAPVSEAIGAAIALWAGGNAPSAGARVLELGVGTGRIAMPVARSGCSVVGIDRSVEMLRHLLAHREREPSLQLQCVQGDITALPFAERSFDAVLAVHVLHLVADWRSALRGVAAVIRNGGVLLLGRDWVDPQSMAGRMRMAFREAVMARGFKTAAPAGGPLLEQSLEALGLKRPAAASADQVVAEWSADIAPAQVLEGIRSRDDAESWVLPDATLEPVCEALDAFARREWPDLAMPQPVTRRFLVGIFRAGG